MMTCAAFTKSPNCASQIDERVRHLEASSRTRSRARPPRRAGCRGPRPAPGRSRRCASGEYGMPRLVVVQHRVAVAERAAPRVLAGEPDARALPRERCRARAPRPSPQSSGCCPATISRARLEHLRELRVDVEALRDVRERLARRSRSVSRGDAGRRLVGAADRAAAVVLPEPAIAGAPGCTAIARRRLVRLLEPRAVARGHRVDVAPARARPRARAAPRRAARSVGFARDRPVHHAAA